MFLFSFSLKSRKNLKIDHRKSETIIFIFIPQGTGATVLRARRCSPPLREPKAAVPQIRRYAAGRSDAGLGLRAWISPLRCLRHPVRVVECQEPLPQAPLASPLCPAEPAQLTRSARCSSPPLRPPVVAPPLVAPGSCRRRGMGRRSAGKGVGATGRERGMGGRGSHRG